MTAARARRRVAALIAYELRFSTPPGGPPDDGTADGTRLADAFVRLADEMERRAGAEYAAVCEEQHGAASQPAGESPAPGGDE